MSPRIAQLERVDAQGQVLQAWDITAWPVRLGRALDSHIAWGDSHLAAHHLTLDTDSQGQLLLHAQPSLNGVQVDGVALGSQAHVLQPGAVWQAGANHWRVRREGEPWLEEQPLSRPAPVHREAPVSGRTLGVLLVAMLGWEGVDLWLGQTPSSTWIAYFTPLASMVAAITLWVLIWGLASKLFTHRYTVWPHLRVVLMYLLAIAVLSAVAGLLAYAFDLPSLSRWAYPLTVALGAAMIAHHLRIVLPQHPKRVNGIVAGLTGLAMVASAALNWQRMDRLLPYQHLSTLPPPAFRVAAAKPVDALMDQLRTLEAPLQAAAQKASDDEEGPAGEEFE
jgi:FHA domain